MKIGFIGCGYVGSAIAWAYRDEEIIIRDPKLKESSGISEFIDCDAIFVCVPSPSLDDGHCDGSILESALKELMFVNLVKDIPIICKTTATPTIYERLHQQYPNIVHCPEFLTARNHIADYQNSNYFVLGGHEHYCEKALTIIQKGVQLTDGKFLITDIKTAALYKYFINSYLATKVTFMNEFKSLADAEGIDYNDLIGLAEYENRIGKSHMQVPGPDGEYGWGGPCFPKDVAAIIEESLDLDADLELLGRVEEINKKHRKK